MQNQKVHPLQCSQASLPRGEVNAAPETSGLVAKPGIGKQPHFFGQNVSFGFYFPLLLLKAIFPPPSPPTTGLKAEGPPRFRVSETFSVFLFRAPDQTPGRSVAGGFVHPVRNVSGMMSHWGLSRWGVQLRLCPRAVCAGLCTFRIRKASHPQLLGLHVPTCPRKSAMDKHEPLNFMPRRPALHSELLRTQNSKRQGR